MAVPAFLCLMVTPGWAFSYSANRSSYPNSLNVATLSVMVPFSSAPVASEPESAEQAPSSVVRPRPAAVAAASLREGRFNAGGRVRWCWNMSMTTPRWDWRTGCDV